MATATKTLVTTVLTLALGLVVGCATSSGGREDAGKLAVDGSAAGQAASASIKITADTLDSFLESEYYNAALLGGGEPSEKIIADVQEIREALLAREAMLDKLVSAYASYGKLAGFDAEKEVREAVGPLVEAINGYNQAVYESEKKEADPPTTQPAVTDAEGELIKQVAGGIAGFAQRQKLLRESEAIRTLLHEIVPIMKREARVYADIEDAAADSQAAVVVELWKLGVGDPHPVFQRILGNQGLGDYDPAQINKILNLPDEPEANKKKKDRVRNLVKEGIKQRLKRGKRARAATIDQTMGALGALERAHLKFEEGSPLDLTEVRGHLAMLRLYADLLRKIAEERRAPTTQTIAKPAAT